MDSHFTHVHNEDEEQPSIPITSSVWKIVNGNNGDKYITFDDTNISASLNDGNEQEKEIKVYKMRWFILTVICMANISNAINWINFSPIADFTGKFYSTDYDHVNWLSLVYLIASTPAGFFSFWFIDNFGVRSSLNIGSWINLLGGIVRLASAIDLADGTPLIPSNYKYTILIIGQTLCALAQPFVIFVATKFATNWFTSSQRALANTIALGSNSFGILIGAVLSPLIVNSSVKFVSEMCLLHLISTGIAVIPALMACFITRSTPPTPPSYSEMVVQSSLSENQGENELLIQGEKSFSRDFKVYLNQVVRLLKSKDFLLLFFCFGFSLGGFNCFTTLIEQIICTKGYNDDDSGYFSGALLLSGLIGSLISGIIIDHTKRYEELSKICFCFTAISNIMLLICLQWNNDNSTVYYLTLSCFMFFGFFGLPLLPICMDMSVECVYPIPEATSTGLLFIAGQVVGVVMILIYPKAAEKIDENSYIYNSIQKCSTIDQPTNNTVTSTTGAAYLQVLDFQNPLYFQTLFFVVLSIGFTCFFKCGYLRLRSEREKIAEKIMRSAATTN